MHGKNQIGNELSATGKKTFTVKNPATNLDLIGDFHECTIGELNKATKLANDALDLYASKTNKQKAKFLKQIVKEIKKDKSQILIRFWEESGLSMERGKVELKRTLDQLKNFAKYICSKKYNLNTIAEGTKKLPYLEKRMIPIGTVAVFGASNFPFAYSTVGGDTAAALAAGCPVIVKSHQMHAGTGELISDCVIRAANFCNIPNGVFSNLNASSIKVGSELVANEFVKAVGFTGSIAGGTALKKIGDERDSPIPVFAEMGSVNPVVMLPSALTDPKIKWSKTLLKSITTDGGQFCTKPGLLFMYDSVESRNFLRGIGEKIVKMTPAVLLGESISRPFYKKRNKLKHVKKVMFFEAPASDLPNRGQQSLLVVTDETFNKHEFLKEEVFGPHCTAVLCKNKRELKKIISNLQGQLTGTINGSKEDLSKNQDLVLLLENLAGRIIFNGVPTGVRVVAAQTHGGTFPASTDSRFTAVGDFSIYRFLRPVTYQNFPKA